MSDPKKILIVRPDAMGDMVFTLPLISALKSYFKGVEMWVLAAPYTRGLLTDHPDVDGVIEDWRNFKCQSDTGSRANYVKAIQSYGFDAVVLVYMDVFYAKVMRDAKIPIRIGDRGRAGFKRYLTRHSGKVNYRDLSCHEVECNMALVTTWLGGAIPPGKLMLPMSQDRVLQSEALLSREGWKRGAYVVVHPTIGEGNRAWLPERYAQFIDRLQLELGVEVVLTGVQNDQEYAGSIVSKCKRAPINLVGLTSLLELKALIYGAKLVVGAQTGPVHLASAFNVPVLSISPTKYIKSFRWGPWKVPHLVVTDTSMCPLYCNTYKSPCDAPFCVEAISISRVFDCARRLLEIPETCPGVPSKVHWFQESGVVACHVLRWTPEVQAAVQQQVKSLQTAGVRVLLVTTSTRIHNALKRHLGAVMSVCIPWWGVRGWIRFLAIQDITIWHFFGGPIPRIAEFIRQFVALRMYVPPICVSSNAISGDTVALIQHYLLKCRDAR